MIECATWEPERETEGVRETFLFWCLNPSVYEGEERKGREGGRLNEQEQSVI